ncbi:MAG: 16S rRNA (uracil(1498)-N(3))-methyltransferase [Cytophagales bacterium]|nr:16S rRNA (uracil(1498)-N(3))-methyltransferase [Bacteroidota bacterium]MBS1980587.1 16S rRNA (uracil(1498)-N(3))-methyltransferase [Bacteroidota bacterium]WHZ07909.1 MAG: 16S rRNA (uracil(1498)-N(3))-methyltransferase [Cytophagales bacterium]
MNLFYQPNIPEGIHYLDRDESHHAVRVMRLGEKQTIDLTDGRGLFYVAKITRADPKKCEFEIIEKKQIARRDFQVHIAIAPTKNADRMEWFVEKVTEIGVDQISFMFCKNSERKVINCERIEKVAVSAMKQSQQAWLPKINDMVSFKEIFSMNADQKFIAYVDASNPRHLQSAAKPEKNYLILVGPEGDFSKDELELALQNGFEKVSLGANRLRTETAALVSCQILNLKNI